MSPPQEPAVSHVLPASTTPMTLEKLVQNIHRVLGPDGGLDSEHIDANEIMQLMEQYSSNATDWSKYTIFDHSRAYTRNLIDDGNGKFNLMILAWSKGQQSPIHDHAGSHCIMKVLDGELQETQYEWPSADVGESVMASDITEAVQSSSSCPIKGKPLTTRQCTRLRPNEVTYIHDKIGLHRISNPSKEGGAVSLHLYTPPYQVCKTFEEHTGRARTGGRCTFYSVGGTRCADQ
ncbi:RmlC-like cupin domain-containing protein [Fennellomyces sp. T-0311]|nr:RmlC-like cupin domain-containing protein [Fennellomyces sp. T-0311]